VRTNLRTFRFAGSPALALLFSLAVSWAFQEKPQGTPSPTPTAASPSSSAPFPTPAATPSPQITAPRMGLNIVVLDPAHGGTDLGARGTEGIHESEVVLQFADQVRRALEGQGFQVLSTREGNDNPSFDDRSARANAQRGAVFVSLHIGSTGLPGTVRTYVMPDLPPANDTTSLIPWDRAQAPFTGLSHKLGDLVQAELARRFKGSPPTAQISPVRQLRTTAAPAIAVEISSVSVQERAELDRMVPGIAEAIAHGVAAFRPSYILPAMPGGTSGPGGLQ
jgi:N-acetylmuramoyl-L-alanine amidase